MYENGQGETKKECKDAAKATKKLAKNIWMQEHIMTGPLLPSANSSYITILPYPCMFYVACFWRQYNVRVVS